MKQNTETVCHAAGMLDRDQRTIYVYEQKNKIDKNLENICIYEEFCSTNYSDKIKISINKARHSVRSKKYPSYKQIRQYLKICFYIYISVSAVLTNSHPIKRRNTQALLEQLNDSKITQFLGNPCHVQNKMVNFDFELLKSRLSVVSSISLMGLDNFRNLSQEYLDLDFGDGSPNSYNLTNWHNIWKDKKFDNFFYPNQTKKGAKFMKNIFYENIISDKFNAHFVDMPNHLKLEYIRKFSEIADYNMQRVLIAFQVIIIRHESNRFRDNAQRLENVFHSAMTTVRDFLCALREANDYNNQSVEALHPESMQDELKELSNSNLICWITFREVLHQMKFINETFSIFSDFIKHNDLEDLYTKNDTA